MHLRHTLLSFALRELGSPRALDLAKVSLLWPTLPPSVPVQQSADSVLRFLIASSSWSPGHFTANAVVQKSITPSTMTDEAKHGEGSDWFVRNGLETRANQT